LRLTDPRDDKRRIENTKGGLLTDSYRWILSNPCFQQWQGNSKNSLLWIKGDPGKGKTMLLCGIINELQSSGADGLVSYFLCQATDSRINKATNVLRGLLYLLVNEQPWLASHLRKRYDAGNESLFEDSNAWIVLTDVCAKMLADPKLQTTYLIIDALDECTTDLNELLELIAKHSASSSRVKWLVSSRNRPDIEQQLEQADNKVRLSLELNASSVAVAVRNFIEQRVDQLTYQKKYDTQTRDAILAHLISNANGTFLWVALVCQQLGLTLRRNALKKLECFPPELDPLYDRMLQQILGSDDADICKQVIVTIVLVQQPISLDELTILVEELGNHDLSTVEEIVGLCGSFLTMREGIVYFVHQSAKDFLLDKTTVELFPQGKEHAHHTIFARSIQAMSDVLKRDMYSLKELGTSIEDVKRPSPDPLAASRYSCMYWVDHLSDSKITGADTSIVDTFLQHKYLYWLEALSLCKQVSKGVTSIVKLRSLLQVRSRTGVEYAATS
jgi:hypothetical protein